MISSTFLYAKEPTMAILVDITTNSTQKFKIKKYNFYCTPYGVITLEKLYKNSKMDSKCKESINSFYKKHPDLKYFAIELLNVGQMYHLEFKNNECVIYAKGQRTLSDILLSEGLALNKPKFKDEEFNFLFERAQTNAKLLKKGVWGDKVLNDCISELYKD
jgi:hypothetical protein